MPSGILRIETVPGSGVMTVNTEEQSYICIAECMDGGSSDPVRDSGLRNIALACAATKARNVIMSDRAAAESHCAADSIRANNQEIEGEE